MPTIYLYPIGAGAQTQLVPELAGPNWSCVDEEPPTLLDWVGIETEGIAVGTDLYTLTAPPADPGGLDSLALTAEFFADKTSDAGAATIQTAARLGVTTVIGPSQSVAADGGSTYTSDLSSRPGGGSWTWADLSTLQLGQRLGAAGGGEGSGESTKTVCYRARLKVVYVVTSIPPSKGVVETMTVSDGLTEALGVGPQIESLVVADGNTEVV